MAYELVVSVYENAKPILMNTRFCYNKATIGGEKYDLFNWRYTW